MTSRSLWLALPPVVAAASACHAAFLARPRSWLGRGGEASFKVVGGGSVTVHPARAGEGGLAVGRVRP